AWIMLIRIGGLDIGCCGLPLMMSLALTTVPRTVYGETGRGDWIRTSDLHTPSVMRYQAALRPDLAAASRQGYPTRQGGRDEADGAQAAKRQSGQVGWQTAVGPAGAFGALSRRGARRFAGARQSRLDRTGARHDRLHRRQ